MTSQTLYDLRSLVTFEAAWADLRSVTSIKLQAIFKGCEKKLSELMYYKWGEKNAKEKLYCLVERSLIQKLRRKNGYL